MFSLRYFAASLSVLGCAVIPAALASPITVPCTSTGCTATITQDANANYGFGNPGQTAKVGYSITTFEDGTNFHTTFSTTNPTAQNFANIYFDTQSSRNTHSNLGFEITNDRAFIPGQSGYYNLAGTGISETSKTVGGVLTIEQIIPNSFFLTDPTGIGFVTTLPGEAVTVHFAQAFGYDVVGGSLNFSLPNELGGASIPGEASPVPEPASLEYMAIAGLGLASTWARRMLSKKRS